MKIFRSFQLTDVKQMLVFLQIICLDYFLLFSNLRIF